MRQRDRGTTWELYALDPDTTYVNFGFWSTVELAPGQVDGVHNRRIERLVEDVGRFDISGDIMMFGPKTQGVPPNVFLTAIQPDGTFKAVRP